MSLNKLEVKYFSSQKKLNHFLHQQDQEQMYLILENESIIKKTAELKVILFNFEDIYKYVEDMVNILAVGFLKVNPNVVSIKFNDRAFSIDFSDELKLNEPEDFKIFSAIKDLINFGIRETFLKPYYAVIIYEPYLEKLKDKFIGYVLKIKDQVIETKKDIELMPMPQLVRNEIHKILSAFPNIMTRSVDTNENRRILIRYKETKIKNG
ncbi:R3H domain-containing nucleic acid-binding protein [Spiroplasma endosymbiont of Labia minor]|uniref:R3H domain-containing nucleic acid-binding protein n=1 Tax=Spiroplasma endosymbiont of Labia minor TaxID=3066305 RepID=UPI0030CD4E33